MAENNSTDYHPAGKSLAKTRIAKKAALATGLRYISAAMPGIKRLRKGNTFVYVNSRGKRISNAATLARIKALAIPPAYEQVWICPQPRGHLQATGIDARGRKQYRYHANWRRVRDADKFARMIKFGSLLPALRRQLKQDLQLPGLPLNKVLALVVTLLQTTLLRVGNNDYAKQNNSFGLTTLRNRHVHFVSSNKARLIFRGKGGKAQRVELTDKQLTTILRRCQELPGQNLFQYVDSGRRQPIDSGMVNDYLLEALGLADDGTGFTAKDFRTWGATLYAVRLLAAITEPPTSKTELGKVTADICRLVADELGNTPAICRKSYINPWVFTAWSNNVKPRWQKSLHSVRSQEQYALRLLKLQARHEKHKKASSTCK